MPRKARKTADDYTREELYARAERKGVKYRSRMNKEQLFKALGLGKPKKKPAAPARKKAAARKPARKKAPAKKAPKRKAAQKKRAAPKKKAAPKRKKPAAVRKAPARKAAAAPAAPRPEAVPAPTPVSVVPPPPPPAPAAAYLDRGPELPAGYGEDRLVALVRDPRCIFVYWDLGGGAYERAREARGQSEMAGGVWVLRLVQVRGGRFFDVPMDPASGNWYLHVEPQQRYRVEIGLVLPSGAFQRLAASGEILTPAETVSDVVDEQWMLVREEFDRLVQEILGARGAVGGIGSSEVLHRLLEVPRSLELYSGSVSSPPGGGR